MISSSHGAFPEKGIFAQNDGTCSILHGKCAADRVAWKRDSCRKFEVCADPFLLKRGGKLRSAADEMVRIRTDAWKR